MLTLLPKARRDASLLTHPVHAVDILIIVAFIVYVVAVGLRARKAASQNLEEYFLAGRTLKGWQAGVSMAATSCSQNG